MKILLILKRLRSNYLLVLFLTTIYGTINAQVQNTIVKGTVVNASDGLPIPGATVVVKGSSRGAVTDFDGNYSVSSKIGDILEFSYIGMESKNVKVSKLIVNVSMDPDVSELEEVVLIGFGAVKKKEAIGAAVQVKSEDIEEYVTPDFASALQGQVAGVNVVASSGEPGENSSIQIRGVTSLLGSNEPLYVVDGIAQSGNPGLSINEIETIDILKDAASTAVYGTRGAAGVILITTKGGKEGRMSVSFENNYGVQFLGDGTPLMNTREQLEFEFAKNAANGTTGNPGPNNREWINNDNDFRSIVLNENADIKTYNLNVSGGTKDFTYNVVGGWFDQQGVVFGSNFKRFNTRATTRYTTDKWKINTSIAYTVDNRDRSNNSILTNAVRYSPWNPLIDRNTTTFFTEETQRATSVSVDQLANALKTTNNSKTDRINVSLDITRKLSDNLSFRTRIGANNRSLISNRVVARFTLVDVNDASVFVDPTKSSVTATASRQTNLSWDGTFTYKKKFGNHNLTATASMSLQETSFENFQASRNGIETNELQTLDGASINPSAEAGPQDNSESTTVGYLGRLQYNYRGKYLFSALVRRDASSRFSPENRWATFPSVLLGWNVSDERFWKPLKSVINKFKIRGGYGTLGNERIPNYSYAAGFSFQRDYVFADNDGSVTSGSSVERYANANVKWETSISPNIGFDMSLFKNKISITADYYERTNKDMLFPVRLPSSTGVDTGGTTIVRNVGTMTNKGLELAINYRTKIGKSKIRLGGTFTKNRNKITDLGGFNELIFNSNSALLRGGTTTVLAEGYEAGAFWLYETNGVIKTQEQLDAYRLLENNGNAGLGDLMYVDKNNDGRIGIEDRSYKGSGLPDFELGFNLSWTYKNLDLAMNWYGTVGSEILNGARGEAFSEGRHKELVNQWTPQNSNSNIPRHVDRAGRDENYSGQTDFFLENGDYLRLKLVTLGYTLPKDVSEKIGLQKLRFYLSSQNPITFTKYKGFDPEVGGNIATRGLDRNRFPLTSQYNFGIRFNF